MKLQHLLLQGGSSEEQLSLCLSESQRSAEVPQPWLCKDKAIAYLRAGWVRSAALAEIHARVPFSLIYLSLWPPQHPGQLFVHQSPSHGLIAR